MNTHHHSRGLLHDLERLRNLQGRRTVLRMMAGASLLPLVRCTAVGADDDEGAGTSGADAGRTDGGADADAGTADAGPVSCSRIPEETAGPYPGDGSNGVNALGMSGLVRQDIRTSIGTSSGTAAGIPLSVTIRLLDVNNGCAALEGYAVYLWHCDQDGLYSMYTLASENYLRGVQGADANGDVTFHTIFPGCYDGRWPHMHFEIFRSVALATASGNKIATSQLALPQSACNQVYATPGYETSVSNLTRTSLTSDNVFSDGSSLQVPMVTGNVVDGFSAQLTVAVRG